MGKKTEELYSLWHFPNYVGAIDGKHIEIQATHNSCSLFFNYKKTFSVVFLALLGANYKFTIIPVGGYGISSDGGLLLMSLHQNNKLFLVYDKRCLVSHWPPASEIGMLLITNFVELRMLAERTRKRAGRPQAVPRRPMLIHTRNAVPMPRCGLEKSLTEQHGRSTVRTRHGHEMASVNHTRPHCVNQMRKTQSKPLSTRHGRGTACYV